MGHCRLLTLSVILIPFLQSGIIKVPSAEVISDKKITGKYNQQLFKVHN
jgi:hypothetical protein